MPRQPKPWFRRQTGWWMVQIDGKQVKLAEGKRNKSLALEKFHELMLLRAEAPESPDVQVASVCEAFLDWSHRRQAYDTYRGYLFYVQSFCEKCGQVLVRELRPYHVTRWLDDNAWNDTTRLASSALRARIKGSTACLAGTERRADAAALRTSASDSLRAAISGCTALEWPSHTRTTARKPGCGWSFDRNAQATASNAGLPSGEIAANASALGEVTYGADKGSVCHPRSGGKA